jgi:hypothetical protein
MELGRSTIINLEVNSALSQLEESDGHYPSQCHITKTVDLLCHPVPPHLRISPCINLHLKPNSLYQLEETVRVVPMNKRYRLAMPANVSTFDAEKIEVMHQPHQDQ